MRATSGRPYGKLCGDLYAVTTEKRDAEGVVPYIVVLTTKLWQQKIHDGQCPSRRASNHSRRIIPMGGDEKIRYHK
nr:MAG TPA: hypothetical protein [Caudoviricetes sp.]